jgi:RNA polymerase sigma-70 factor (ECF subfamily)
MGVGLPAPLEPSLSSGDHAEPRSAVTQTRPQAAAPILSDKDAARLAELLRVHYARVWRTLRRLGVEQAAADDAAQEAFIVLSRRLLDVVEGAEQTFLLSCAVRIAANHRRTWRVKHEVADELALGTEPDPKPDAEQLLEQKRLREALDDLLETWPDDVRIAFVLFELEGLSMPEIAHVTETKLGTVASRLRRGRELFQAGAKRLRARSGVGEEP